MPKTRCGRPIPTHSEKSAPGASNWRARLQDYLKKENLRFSEQRFQIAELILLQGGHLTASQIIARVKESHPEIGPATVYRNLKVLCDAQILIESFSDAQGQTIYERHGADHHDHIVCLDCGLVVEFHNAQIERAQDQLTTELSFNPISHRHVIYARCELLKKKAKAR